jgi:hypothetical protein
VNVVRAYFLSRDAAEKARVTLGVFYKTSEPEPVEPWHGRPWLVEVTVPTSMTLAPRVHPNPTVMARIVSVVQQYDGEVHNTEV